MTNILERLKRQPKVNGAYVKDIEDAIKEIETLSQREQDMSNALDIAISEHRCKCDELTAERAISNKLENALTFYADETMFKTHIQGDHENPDMVVPVAEDQGDIARAALAELAAMRKGETE